MTEKTKLETEKQYTHLIILLQLLDAHIRQLIPRESAQQQITLQRPTLPRLMHQSRSQRILLFIRVRKGRDDIVGRCGGMRHVRVCVWKWPWVGAEVAGGG